VPYDFYPGIQIALMILSSAGIVGTLAMGTAVYKYRAHPVIRYASPVFCAIILGGLIMAYMSVYFVAGEITKGLCAASQWFGHLSFCIIFSSLFAKTYRLSQLFNNKSLKNIRISDTGITLLKHIIQQFKWFTYARFIKLLHFSFELCAVS